jgi:hypothetical protein
VTGILAAPRAAADERRGVLGRDAHRREKLRPGIEEARIQDPDVDALAPSGTRRGPSCLGTPGARMQGSAVSRHSFRD